MNVFHNPNARYPLDEYFLPDCMHHRLKGDQIVHSIPEFHPYTAETVIVSPEWIEHRRQRSLYTRPSADDGPATYEAHTT